jgi:REP element-mobilizing transposase RayT
MKRRRPTKKPIQLTLDSARRPTGHGGWRPGAGRPRGRTKVAHETRDIFTAREPNHVTLRVVEGVRSLRRQKLLQVVKRAISAGGRAESFRIVHFNLLANHLHFLVEATGARALARGMQGLEVRLARGFNRVLERKGKLFAERYHARVLRSPREVKNALRYVLLNARHHAREAGVSLARTWIDPYSSAAWFDGWEEPIRPDEPWLRQLLGERCPTARAASWLLSTGWRRTGLLRFDEVPGRAVIRDAVPGHNQRTT